MSGAGQLQDYSVDQAAGAVVLILGAVASLLLVIWQSRCHCKMNMCYIFQCERRPPTEDQMETLKEKAEALKKKKEEKDKKKKEEKLIPPVTPRTEQQESEPEPEMLLVNP